MQAKQTVGDKAARGVSTLHRAILLGSLSFGILQFSLPIYARQMGASALDIGAMVSIFAVMITIARPLVGWGIDHFGEPRASRDPSRGRRDPLRGPSAQGIRSREVSGRGGAGRSQPSIGVFAQPSS